MLTAQHKKFYELQKKSWTHQQKKTPENSRALQEIVAMLEAKTDNTSNQNLFPDEKLKANNRYNPALDRKGSGTRQNSADT